MAMYNETYVRTFLYNQLIDEFRDDNQSLAWSSKNPLDFIFMIDITRLGKSLDFEVVTYFKAAL